MTSLPLRVNLAERSYDIAVTSGDAAGLGRFARERARGDLAFVVSDANVATHATAAAASLAAAGFQTATEILLPGEAQKALAIAAELYDRLAELHADRRTLVVAAGGGVIGDLAGFVAAT